MAFSPDNESRASVSGGGLIASERGGSSVLALIA